MSNVTLLHNYTYDPLKNYTVDRLKQRLHWIDIDRCCITTIEECYFEINISQNMIDELLAYANDNIKDVILINNTLTLLGGSLSIFGYSIDNQIIYNIFEYHNKNNEVQDNILRMIEKQPQMFSIDFIKSLNIDVGYLKDYRDSIINDVYND